ncbi:MAG TPA: hypothetical protein VG309_04930 [Rhizomicrobium sp.]|jgi:hypothetical protein|nr:hypothetical protein [Rhizomicrobium sp.]
MSDIIVRRDELALVGDAQEVLREYDDVQLLRPIKSSSAGNVTVDIFPTGTRATIIGALEGNQAMLECYVGSNGFAFAEQDAAQLRLIQRREEKLKNA